MKFRSDGVQHDALLTLVFTTSMEAEQCSVFCSFQACNLFGVQETRCFADGPDPVETIKHDAAQPVFECVRAPQGNASLFGEPHGADCSSVAFGFELWVAMLLLHAQSVGAEQGHLAAIAGESLPADKQTPGFIMLLVQAALP